MKSVLAIAPALNTPGRKDATGAFQPEATTFVRLHGGSVRHFDNSAPKPMRLREVLNAIDEGRHDARYSAIGFFCHGLKSALQIGAGIPQVPRLAAAIHRAAPGAPIALYACDAARDLDASESDDLEDGPGGRGGFASALAYSIGGSSWVDAHVTTAHTTRNPYVRRFRSDGIGTWIVAPGDPLWASWRERLREDQAFRLSFPLRHEDEIRASL